jgi:hypothetical protein
MMVEVLVGQAAPLVAAQAAEEGMRLATGGLGAMLHHTVHEGGHADALRFEVPQI